MAPLQIIASKVNLNRYILFHEIKEQYFTNDLFLCEVSMGMSQDYTSH